MGRRVAVVILVAITVLPSTVWAQDAGEADALIDRGLDLREAGDDLGARGFIERAYSLAPTPRSAAQLGLVEQALGLWVPAETHLDEALRATDDPWIERNRDTLEESLAVVRENLGSLEVISPVVGARIVVNGETLGTTPLAVPLRVNVGRISIEVQADGHVSRTFSVEITAGRLARQLAELAVAAPATTVPPPDSVSIAPSALPARTDLPPPSGPSIVWGWVLSGLTLAASGTGIGLGVAAQSAYDGLSVMCGDAGCSDAQIAASQGEGLALGANASFGVAAAAAIAALVAFIVEATASTRVAPLALRPPPVLSW